MTKEPIDMKYSYTCNGEPVEFITTSGRKPFPVIGYVGDRKTADVWTSTGEFWYNDPHYMDLIRVPTKREGWINLFQEVDDIVLCGYEIHETPELALAKTKTLQTGRALATIRIEWEE